MAELSDEHRAILDLERTWWKYAGAKESEIRRRFGIPSTRYYQVLSWIINQPAALEHDPMTVRRLTRLRDRRAAQRSARRRGFSVG